MSDVEKRVMPSGAGPPTQASQWKTSIAILAAVLVVGLLMITAAAWTVGLPVVALLYMAQVIG